jgi:3-oxoacyl-[acyl-carrier protein] reductase
MADGKELDGRVAIVTGGARNIGRAIARELAAGGAAVVVNARTSGAEAEAVAREIEGGGGRALAFVADVTDEKAVGRMAAAALDRFGRIDILVNNAAVRREQPLAEMTLGAWREILGIILDGAFICAQACLPQLAASGRGAIVNIGGLTAHLGAGRRAHVVTAKAGLVALTRALAHELAAANVTVNCVSPGRIATARRGPEPNAHRVPSLTGASGKPDDIAATVRFLCGPGARYITGQTIHVNGGAYLGS